MSGADKTYIEFKVDVSGADGVVQQFTTAGSAIRARVADVLKELGDELARKAQARVPVRSGQLRHSVEAGEVRTTSDLQRMSVTVRPWGPRRNQKAKYGNYAVGLFTERGLAAKTFFKRRALQVDAQRVRISKRGKVTPGRLYKKWRAQTIRRKPVPAQPFMAPAFLSMRDSITARIDAAIDAGMKAAAA